MSAAWTWFKKYWELVAGGVLLFLGVFLGWWFKKSPIIIGGDDPEKKAIDIKVAEEEKKIQRDVAVKKAELSEAHSKEIADVVAAEVANEPVLEKDPDATNAFLKQVGREARGDDNGGSQ